MTNKSVIKKIAAAALALTLACGIAAPSGLSVADFADDIAISASADPSVTITDNYIEGVNLSVDDSFGLNIYVYTTVSNFKIKYTSPNDNVEHEATVGSDELKVVDTNKYKITVPVFPKHVDNDFIVQFFDGDTPLNIYKNNEEGAESANSLTYNVGTYCNSLIRQYENSTEDEEKKAAAQFATAILNYGRWAYAYLTCQSGSSNDSGFNEYLEYSKAHGNDSIIRTFVEDSKTYYYVSPSAETFDDSTVKMNGTFLPTWWKSKLTSGISVEQSLNNEEPSGKMTISYTNDSGYTTLADHIYYKASLVLDEKLKVRIYFNSMDGVKSVKLFRTKKGGAQERIAIQNIYRQNSESMYYVEVDNLTPDTFNDAYQLQIVDHTDIYGDVTCTFTTTVNQYIRQTADSYNETATGQSGQGDRWVRSGFVSTMRALYAFELTAKKYAAVTES